MEDRDGRRERENALLIDGAARFRLVLWQKVPVGGEVRRFGPRRSEVRPVWPFLE